MIECILAGLCVFFLIMALYAKINQNPVEEALNKPKKSHRKSLFEKLNLFIKMLYKELWQLDKYPHLDEQEVTSASILVTGLIALTALITFQSILYTVIIGALSFIYLPKFYIKYKLAKLKKQFSQSLGAATSALGSSIRGGRQLLHGIMYTASELKPMSEAVANEFEILAEELNSNVPVEMAAKDMAKRIDTEEAYIFAESLSLLSFVGSNSEKSARLLQTAASFVNEQNFLKERIASTTGYIMLGYAFCCFIVIALSGYIYMVSAPFRAFYQTDQAKFNLLIFLVFLGFGWWLVYQMKKRAEKEI